MHINNWYWFLVYEKTVKAVVGNFILVTPLLTYLLTPWSRGFLEKLNGLQLVKKFPTQYGT